MIQGQDILCLSSQDWNDLWTRKQRFMQKYASQGNRVLYVEAQASLVSFRIIKKDWFRIFRWLRGPRKVEGNLFIVTLPLVIPFFQMSLIINKINNWVIVNILRLWIKKLEFKKTILCTYTPYSESLIGKLNEKLAIYGCVDELTASKGLIKPQVIDTLEKRLIEKVDIVIVTHENLYKSKKPLAKNIYLIQNGAEVEHFKKTCLRETPIAPEIESIPKPIIGFLGCINYWIDLDLICYIASLKPRWSIVLIGPIERLAKVKKINHFPNVYLLGRKDYNDLPSYIKALDVCINPYIINETANNCCPLKLYEYLSSGKPVVSVEMPEAKKFNGLIEIGTDYKDFVKKIEIILSQLPEESASIKARINAVEQYSWTHLFLKLEKVLELYLNLEE